MVNRTFVCLYHEFVADINEGIIDCNRNGYDVIVMPIVSQLFYREFEDTAISLRHLPFSRSELILTANQWIHLVIAKINDNIDCDSDDETVRKHSEKTIMQEISFAEHLLQQGFILYKLKTIKCVNLARMISQCIKGNLIFYIYFIKN